MGEESPNTPLDRSIFRNVEWKRIAANGRRDRDSITETIPPNQRFALEIPNPDSNFQKYGLKLSVWNLELPARSAGGKGEKSEVRAHSVCW